MRSKVKDQRGRERNPVGEDRKGRDDKGGLPQDCTHAIKHQETRTQGAHGVSPQGTQSRREDRSEKQQQQWRTRDVHKQNKTVPGLGSQRQHWVGEHRAEVPGNKPGEPCVLRGGHTEDPSTDHPMQQTWLSQHQP